MSKIKWLSVIVLSVALSGSALAGRGGGGGGHGGGGHGGGGHGGGGGGHFGGGGGHFGGGHFGGARAGGFHGGGGHVAARGGHFGGSRAAVSHAGRGGAAISHASRGGNFANTTRGGNFGHGGTFAGRNAGALSHHAALRASAVHHALAGAAVAGALHNHNALNNPGNRANITSAAARAGWQGRGGGWWGHANGGFGWVGPLFWPFAFYDLYDYAFWGWGPAFWDYGYGDIYAGVFAPYGYNDLAGYLPYGGSYGYGRSTASSATASGPNEVAQMCGEDTQDVAGLPVDRIQQELQLNDAQKRALDALADASVKASQTIRDACPTQVASTAPGRLAAMQNRIEAMISAVNIVEPALDHFYDLLNDEQKVRLTALGRDMARGNKNDILAQGCGNGQPGQMDWPSAEIERRLRPTEAQQASLNNLKDASARAQDMLKDSCQPNQPLTPPARLEAEAKRLNAMLQAVETVKSALDDFYSELSDEQKAQFESIGPGRGSFASGSADETSPAPGRHHHRRHYGRHYVSVGGIVRRLIGF